MKNILLACLLFFCTSLPAAQPPPMQHYAKINALRSSQEVLKIDWRERCENCSDCCFLIVPTATCCCISAKLLARWYHELTPAETAVMLGASGAWIAWGFANRKLRERNMERQMLRNQLKVQETKKTQ